MRDGAPQVGLPGTDPTGVSSPLATMTVLLTHACQYAGPGIVPVLLRNRRELFCHDAGFVDPGVARAFESQHRGATALTAQAPVAIANELIALRVSREAVIHNDVHPNTPPPQ